MIEIQIHDEAKTEEDMALMLERIAGLVRQGYRSGAEPSWELNGTPLEPENCKRCEDCDALVDPALDECDECGSDDLHAPDQSSVIE